MIELTNTLPPYAFSGDQIRAKFAIPDVYVNQGEFAVNEITIPSHMNDGDVINLVYGGRTIQITAKTVPDDSGYQIQANPGGHLGLNIPIEIRVKEFKGNYILSRDFEITDHFSGKMILTAREKGTGYNITGYNTTPGTDPLLKTRLFVRFSLYCENPDNTGFENIYESSVNVKISGNSGTAEVPIGDKLHKHILAEIRENLPDIPGADPLLCKKTCRRYYFEYAESYNDIVRKRMKSDVFTVLHGGLSTLGQATTSLPELIAPGTIDQDRFLKQGAQIIKTRPDQLQYLYFFNTRPAVTINLNCAFYFSDGDIDVFTLDTFDLDSLRKIGFNVRFQDVFNPDDYPDQIVVKYEIFLTNELGDLISETRVYLLDYKYYRHSRYFLSYSSWGTMDSRMFYGRGSSQFELTQSEAERSNYKSSDIQKGKSLVFNKSIKSIFSTTTGFLSDRSTILFNRDLFLSALIYVPYKEKLLPIKITSNKVSELSDGNNLFAQSFDYQYLYDDHAFSEGDIETERYADINPDYSNLPIIGQNGDFVKLTLISYAAMVALIPFEKPNIFYKYNIKHDEENGDGKPAVYLRCDGGFIRLIPQEATL